MHEESFDEFEQQLAAMQAAGAPTGLRSTVQADVHRELRAARWDRRLARTAAMLLIVGVGMNASLVLPGTPSRAPRSMPTVADRAQNSLIETAVVVAEATDADTGRRFAQHLAALKGRELSTAELSAIEAAGSKRTPRVPIAGSEG